MLSNEQRVIALSATISPLVMILLYHKQLPVNVIALSAALGLLAVFSTLRLTWLSYILSMSALSIIIIYTTNALVLSVLLYVVFSSLIGVRPLAPTLGSEAKRLIPAIIIALLSILYASLLTYTLSSTNIQGFKKLGETGPGIAIIYGFATLFAVSLAFGYYSGYPVIPQEVLVVRKIFNNITPDNGFKIALYIASLTPSIIYHEPIYIVATLISYFIKLFTPLTNKVKNMDIFAYSITYFIILKILGTG